nr:hypothetical protein [uncultured bacterium]
MPEKYIEMELTSDEAFLVKSMREDPMLKKALFNWMKKWKEGPSTEGMVQNFGEAYE